MKEKTQQMIDKEIQPEFYYSIDLIENLNNFPLNTVIPCSVVFLNELVGGLLLICKKKDIKYIGLNPPNNPNTYHNFRMMHIDQKTFAIEIHLIFDQDKTVKMHLEPIAKSTIEFIKLCIESKKISFHFYDKQSISLTSSVLELDDEDIKWFKRNYELMKKLKGNDGYDLICNLLIKEFDAKDRLYSFYDNENVDCFIGKNKVVKFGY